MSEKIVGRTIKSIEYISDRPELIAKIILDNGLVIQPIYDYGTDDTFMEVYHE